MALASWNIDPEILADEVGSMRLEASIRAKHSRIELYAKFSRRVRVEQRPDAPSPHVQCVAESGLAARAWTAQHERAGFAAAAGTSRHVAAWVVDRATRADATASPAGLEPTAEQPGTRWDLDPHGELPDTQALITAMVSSPNLRWLEAGTTLEVLVGPDRGCAVRRRHRAWAEMSHGPTRLVAKRGLAGWEELARQGSNDPDARPGGGRGDGSLLFTPAAAAPLVAALVGAVHTGVGLPEAAACGIGWTIGDDPRHPAGLSGGVFDDAGFPTSSRPLAERGRLAGCLAGPGTYWRGSFREPPASAPSNLIMPPGEPGSPGGAARVLSCQVIRLAPELWVLDLELEPDPESSGAVKRAHARVTPASVLKCCSGRVGAQRVSAAGPIVPALLFNGLELIDSP